MLQILNVDTSRQDSESCTEQTQSSHRGRMQMVTSADGRTSEYLIVETPLPSPALKESDHSRVLHVESPSHDITLEEASRHTQDGRSLHVEAVRSPHACLLDRSEMVLPSPTPRMLPTAASDSPSQPRISPISSPPAGRRSDFDGRLSEDERTSWAVSANSFSGKTRIGGVKGDLDVIEDAANDLLSSGLIREDLQELARRAMEEGEEGEEDVEQALVRPDSLFLVFPPSVSDVDIRYIRKSLTVCIKKKGDPKCQESVRRLFNVSSDQSSPSLWFHRFSSPHDSFKMHVRDSSSPPPSSSSICRFRDRHPHHGPHLIPPCLAS